MRALTTVVWICLLAMSMRGQSIPCSNNGDIRSQAARGPDGSLAVFRVHTEDDHGKNTHACEADYYLAITPAGQQKASDNRILVTSGDWGRTLSVSVDGFTRDGKHVFGVISESGKYSSATVFDYNISGARVEVQQIRKGLTQLKAVHCGTFFAVAGRTQTRYVVLEPRTSNTCRKSYRWRLNRNGELKSLEHSALFLRLYDPK